MTTIKREAAGRLERQKDPESRTISGTAIVFDTPAVLYSDDRLEIREIIARESVDKTLLDSSDIKMLLFHNRERILARSKKGEGTLSYEVTDKGVRFTFDAPDTPDGNLALRGVQRRDLDGCSFAFSVADEETSVKRDIEKGEDGRRIVTYTVMRMQGVYDFTITPDPAYSQTDVSARDWLEAEKDAIERERKAADAETDKEKREKVKAQVGELLAAIK